MKSVAVWVQAPYSNDELFRSNSPLNRDDCLAPFHELRAKFEHMGWACHTHDVFLASGRTPSDVLFLDMPAAHPRTLTAPWAGKARMHLLIQECAVVLPRNWDLARHNDFELVFTWSPDLIARGGRYVEANFAQRLRPPSFGAPFPQRKLVTLISGNKASAHPLELYSKRLGAIQFFEQTAAADFDLYGVGWDQLAHHGIFNKILNKAPSLACRLAPRFGSYRGRVDDKKSTLEKYRFAICFENAKDIQGYVTEKIFDCLMAGCVPVYWGAPDIAARVPPECFIDFRALAGFEELLERMQVFSEEDFMRFLESSRKFLSGEAAQRYSAANFASAITKAIKSV